MMYNASITSPNAAHNHFTLLVVVGISAAAITCTLVSGVLSAREMKMAAKNKNAKM